MYAFGLFEAMFPIFFVVVFAIIIGGVLFTIVSGAWQWHQNNQSPRLTVNATVVSKRTNVSHHHHAGNDNMVGHTSTSTSYYVTFQVESGDRMELHLTGREYGMLAEGDQGQLHFQGTRYLGFDRQ